MYFCDFRSRSTRNCGSVPLRNLDMSSTVGTGHGIVTPAWRVTCRWTTRPTSSRMHEILENADEFFTVLECMYVVVTDGPCYFKGEDLEAWRRFHTWVRTTLKDMYPDDPDFDEDWVEGFEVHVEGCQ